MPRLLQNEDFKSESDLTGAGGTKSQLLNDTKIYVSANSINKTLDDAIVDGDLGGGTYEPKSFDLIDNLGIAASVASNALTVRIKGADGNDPSSSNVVKLGFRNATATTGTPVIRSITSATGLVADSGATLGLISGSSVNIYVYAVDNAGTIEMALSSKIYDESTTQTIIAIDSSSDADSLYGNFSRTNVAIRLIGRVHFSTAPNGTYSTAPAELAVVDKSFWSKYLNEVVGFNSATKTPTSTFSYLSMTGNSILLQPGRWELKAGAYFTQSGGAGWGQFILMWADANGADTSTQPTELNITTGDVGFGRVNYSLPSAGSFEFHSMPPVYFNVTTSKTIYFVIGQESTTPANGRVKTVGYAKRIS